MDKNLFLSYLEPLRNVSPSKPSLERFKDKSLEFGRTFPTDEARFHKLQKKGKSTDELESVIHSTYPLVHESVLPLMVNFIQFKKQKGTQIERNLYDNIGLVDFINRILKNRPATFYGKEDRYLLYDFTPGYGGFEEIGTDRESMPLTLRDYMSYDEMKIASLFNISSESYFINNGARDNKGVPGGQGSFTRHGVIVGQIGARMKKPGKMEWQDCVITNAQNTAKNGYGESARDLPEVWQSYWKLPLPTWEEANDPKCGKKYAKLFIRNNSQQGRNSYNDRRIDEAHLFNTAVYKKRTFFTATTLLLDATKRAISMGKKAYIHVVGLGLGVWRVANYQESMFIDAWADAIKSIDTTHISDIDFSWFDEKHCGGVKNGELFPKTQVRIHFSRRSLHDKVPDDTFLICNFAWDGNSLPGNEYWTGKKASTGDSAAASSSCVAELHNHYINDMVTAENLHIVTTKAVLHVAEYVQHYVDGTLEQVDQAKIPIQSNGSESNSKPSSSTSNWDNSSKYSESSRSSHTRRNEKWGDSKDSDFDYWDSGDQKKTHTHKPNNSKAADWDAGYQMEKLSKEFKVNKNENVAPDPVTPSNEPEEKLNDSLPDSEEPKSASGKKKYKKKKSSKKSFEIEEMQYDCIDFKKLDEEIVSSKTESSNCKPSKKKRK